MRCFARHHLGIFVLSLTAACAIRAAPGSAVSSGPSNHGTLEGGVPFPDEGPGFVRARRGESTRYGLPQLVALIQTAAAEVDRRYPGGHPLRVGDLSAPFGGRHSRHGSHRTGRDVDLIFYATDVMGSPIRGRGWVAYDRFGTGVEPTDRGGEVVLFDEARNWALVRALLTDADTPVQWIFLSRGIKARLLRYAATVEADPEVIARATWVLHQPSRGNPHADHFHVRLYCGAEQLAVGCRDRGPRWTWYGDRIEKLDIAAPPEDDAFVISALLDPIDPLNPTDSTQTEQPAE